MYHGSGIMYHGSVHNRDQAEIFQNTLIERTPKAAFRALDFISKTF